MSATLHPEVLWAQRSSDNDAEKNVVFVTINLPDIIENTLKFDLTPTGFKFAATSGNAAKGLPEKNYAIDVTFFDEIDVEASTKVLTTRHLALRLRKKKTQLEFWPRLTKDKQARGSTIKTDFDKWVDEDEQDAVVDVPDEDVAGPPGGGFDPSMLSGLGGGAGGQPDFASMMGGLGGAGGQPDFAKMMAQMGGAGGPGGPSGFGGADEGDDSDDDDDGPPPLEETDK